MIMRIRIASLFAVIFAAAFALQWSAQATTLEDALLDALVAKGAPGDAAVVLVGKAPRGLDPETLQIAALDYDAASGRFVAKLKLASGRLFGLQGKVEAGADLPVLTRALRAGEVASEADISIVRIANSRIPRGALGDIGDIAGFSAKRQLRAGVPLRAGDFEKPVVVKKGDAVSMVFRAPGVELTTRGKAMTAGGMGDTIAVMNAQSMKQVDAVITGSGAVTVSPATLALN